MLLKIAVFLFALAARAAWPVTVEDLVRIAGERNRELQALRQRVAEARGQLRQAGVRPPPSVEVETSAGRPLGSPGRAEYSAAFSQPVETAGKRGKRLRAAEKGVGLAEAELAVRTLRLAGEIKLAVLEALSERRRAESLESLLEAYEASLKLTAARVAQGDAAPLESRLLLAEMGRVRAQRRAVEGRWNAALIELRRLCGLSEEEPLELAASPPPPGGIPALADLQRRGLSERPDLRAARIAEEQAEAQAALAEAQGRADLTLLAGYSHRKERLADLRDRDNILTFGVAIPLLSRRRNQGNVESAAARAAAARSLREHLERTAPLEIAAAWRRWKAAEESAGILDADVLPPSEKNLEVVRQAYALGQLRMLDVLNEQRRMIDTRMSAIDARAEAARAWVELEQAVGGEIR